MALWGIKTGAESKPKYLTQADKNNTVAKPEGWVLKTTRGARKLEEVLVAMSSQTNLSTALAEATITGVWFNESTLAQGATGRTVVVNWNENVDITAGATLVVTGSVGGAITATAAAQTGVNNGLFTFTVPATTQNLSIAAQTITATVVDTGTAVVSDKAFETGDLLGSGGTGAYAVIAVA
jgi:hypothetical protein